MPAGGVIGVNDSSPPTSDVRSSLEVIAFFFGGSPASPASDPSFLPEIKIFVKYEFPHTKNGLP